MTDLDYADGLLEASLSTAHVDPSQNANENPPLAANDGPEVRKRRLSS